MKDHLVLNDGSQSSEVSIGLSLSFENGRTSVVDVYGGTGAYDSDIRPGDEIISIEDTPIVSYENIEGILDGKKAGDEIKIVIYRDGEEIEKYVNLKRKRSNSFSFDLPEEFGTGELWRFQFWHRYRLNIQIVWNSKSRLSDKKF